MILFAKIVVKKTFFVPHASEGLPSPFGPSAAIKAAFTVAALTTAFAKITAATRSTSWASLGASLGTTLRATRTLPPSRRATARRTSTGAAAGWATTIIWPEGIRIEREKHGKNKGDSP